MQELKWLGKQLPSFEYGINHANKLYWNLTINEGIDGDLWFVHAGEPVILKTDSKDCLEAFLYGIGLAYSVLPEPIFEQLRTELRKLVE